MSCITITKQRRVYNFVCFMPDYEGFETNTISGTLYEDNFVITNNTLIFTDVDDKKMILNNIKCIFKQVENPVSNKK